ncbi:MAG: hypothetical protein CM15mP49_23320 [Actinomycetota bacterium]|nr:MAG: hypothetical protein CM15mP49_23320 [Actinomycetota bacterium]
MHWRIERNWRKTSKTPGATQLINVYELSPEGSGHWLVDLPGYGFAKAPKQEMERWRRMIEEYLMESESLGGTIVLIDSLVGLQNWIYRWLSGLTILIFRIVSLRQSQIRFAHQK